MQRLKDARRIGGPHVYERLVNAAGDEVHLFGEDHRNLRACRASASAGVEDVVSLLKACAAEGHSVYIELSSRRAAEQDGGRLVCASSSSSSAEVEGGAGGGPGPSPSSNVLNRLRTCMYLLKKNRPELSIHFVDAREHFGPRSYSPEEDAFIAAMIQRPDAAALTLAFVDPLLRADAELAPGLEPRSRALWNARVTARTPVVRCAIRRHAVGTAAAAYRDAFDDVMNVYALDVLMRELRGSPRRPTHHLVYTGSAHTHQLSAMLRASGFQQKARVTQAVDASCLLMP